MMRIANFALPFVAGAVAALLVAAFLLPRMLVEEFPSSYEVDETVDRLSKAAEAEGWIVAGVRKLDESVAKNGGPHLRPVRLVELCEPHYAGAILENGANGRLSALMPCTISVYEKGNGRIYVAALNVSLFGSFYGGAVARVFRDRVAPDQKAIINSVRPADAARERGAN